jgi:hypothetical protein
MNAGQQVAFFFKKKFFFFIGLGNRNSEWWVMHIIFIDAGG